jgi:hypothetical protein
MIMFMLWSLMCFFIGLHGRDIASNLVEILEGPM